MVGKIVIIFQPLVPYLIKYNYTIYLYHKICRYTIIKLLYPKEGDYLISDFRVIHYYIFKCIINFICIKSCIKNYIIMCNIIKLQKYF